MTSSTLPGDVVGNLLIQARHEVSEGRMISPSLGVSSPVMMRMRLVCRTIAPEQTDAFARLDLKSISSSKGDAPVTECDLAKLK